jgi:hypothetical protein
MFYAHDAELKRNASALTLFVISAAVSLRVLLRTHPDGYGFALLWPATIGYHMFFFSILGAIVDKKMGYYAKGVYAVTLTVFFGYLVFLNWEVSHQWYKKKKIPVGSERGLLLSHNNQRTRIFKEAIAYLRKETKETDKVVVLPEGIALNVFSDRENPMGLTNFIPPNPKVIGEDVLISEFVASEVDYVVIVHRYTREHGAAVFGVDYARRLYAWIAENYRPVKQMGPYPFESNRFGIVVLKKNDSRP